MKINLRNFVLLAFAFTWINNSIAQRDSSVSLINRSASALLVDDGDRLFDEGQIRPAMSKYSDAIDKNPFSSKAHFGYANCQYKILNYGFAENSARTSFDLDPEFADAIFLLASCKHRLGNLEDAKKFYQLAAELYNKGNSKDLNIPFLIECIAFAQKTVAQGPKHQRKDMKGINSDFMDYSPVLYDNAKRIFFVSRRNNTTGGMRNPSDQVYFEDIYHAVWNSKTQEWDSLTNKLGKLNTAGFDAVSHISADGMTLYLTVNNTMVPKIKMKNRTGSSDIATVKMSKNGTWPASKIAVGGINSDFFEGSPALTADGKTIYFSAQRRTSEGAGTEIMASQLIGKTWSKAVALSTQINNKGRQTTPYVSQDGNYLFFSSDSHVGLGGYDVFVSKRKGDSWSKPVNMGFGINSVNDDTHFKYYPQWNMGIFASIVVDDNKATYNIYTVDMSGFDLESMNFEF